MEDWEKEVEGRLYIAQFFISFTFLTMWLYYLAKNNVKKNEIATMGKQEKVTSVWNKFWVVPTSKKGNELGLEEKSEQRTLQFRTQR